MWHLVVIAAVGNIATKRIANNHTFFGITASVDKYGSEELIYVDFTSPGFVGPTKEIFTNDQQLEIRVPTANNGVNEPTIIAANSLASVAFIPSFYSVDLLFIGTHNFPDEIRAHTEFVGCVDGITATFPSVTVDVTDTNGNTVQREIDLTYGEGAILSDCYRLFDKIDLCTESSDGLVLSNLGYYLSQSQMCFYRPYQDETDYVNAVFTSALIIAFVAFFMHITQLLQHHMNDETINYVWQQVVV